MSKLTEAMQILEPVRRPDNWDGERWLGQGRVPALVSAALEDISEVDAMMNEIARATSLPATAEERADRAVEMAAAEMRGLDPSGWPAWVMELLESAQPAASDDQYRVALQGLADRISARLGNRRA